MLKKEPKPREIQYKILNKENKNLEDNVWQGGFGGVGVSVLASGTRVHGFKPDRSHRIFVTKKSSARLSSEGK